MNRQDLYRAFNEIDDGILQRSEDALAAKALSARRLSIVLVAALLSVFLLGAGMMSGIFGDSIQSWFAHYWEEITGQPMSGGHAELIDHLSQEIGLSETVEGITVTVDSATTGVDSFFILLRVEGTAFSKKHAYGFDETLVELERETVGETVGIFGGYSVDYLGLDADGTALLLISYDYTAKDISQEELPPLKVTLSMTDFAQNPRTNKRVMLAEGEWSFTFSLDRNKLDIKELPDTCVMAVDRTKRDEYTEVPVVLMNIELSNTGLRFQYDSRSNELDIPAFFSVILNNGQEIGINGAIGNVLPGGKLEQRCTWRIPVDLDEVVAIKIGETLIEVP